MNIPINTLIFDMDGVITTEEKYWACVRLTFWEVVTHALGLADSLPNPIHDEQARLTILPDTLIYALKSRAVNSNWDITYMVACLYMASMPGARAYSAKSPDDLYDTLRTQRPAPADWPDALETFLTQTDATGRVLIDQTGHYAMLALGITQPGLMDNEGALWQDLNRRFQRFYTGEALRSYGGVPLQDGTVLPPDQLHRTLRALRESGFVLGSATGRPMSELLDGLVGLGLLDYFDLARMGTYDKVFEAERALTQTGLAKPHPYSLLYALYPDKTPTELTDPSLVAQARPHVAMIGDSTSDIVMAKAAGCYAVGVLTGVRGAAAKHTREGLLRDAGADVILTDISELVPYLLEYVGQLAVTNILT